MLIGWRKRSGKSSFTNLKKLLSGEFSTLKVINLSNIPDITKGDINERFGSRVAQDNQKY